jgi:hypothetical protein
MSIPDATGALVAVLKAEPAIAALVGARVFGQSLPAKEATDMPRAAVVLQDTGGPTPPGISSLLTQQMDIRTYGKTSSEAKQLQLTVINFLQSLLRGLSGQTLIYSCVMLTGSYYGEDSDGLWPFFFSVWNINSSLQAAS